MTTGEEEEEEEEEVRKHYPLLSKNRTV